MKIRFRGYKGFDDEALHEYGELVARGGGVRDAAKRKSRADAAKQADRRPRHDKFDDETQRQRIARVKAWGVPY